MFLTNNSIVTVIRNSASIAFSSSTYSLASYCGPLSFPEFPRTGFHICSPTVKIFHCLCIPIFCRSLWLRSALSYSSLWPTPQRCWVVCPFLNGEWQMKQAQVLSHLPWYSIGLIAKKSNKDFNWLSVRGFLAI